MRFIRHIIIPKSLLGLVVRLFIFLHLQSVIVSAATQLYVWQEQLAQHLVLSVFVKLASIPQLMS